MHELFNKFIFDSEVLDCEREGLNLSLANFSYCSNADIIDLIEGKERGSPGILTIMDDLVLVRRNGEEDQQLLAMLERTHGHGKTSSFKEKKRRTKQDKGEFEIIHFAGSVTYQIEGFIEKNKDTIHEDITQACGRYSSSQFLNGLFSEMLNGARPKRKRNTIGTKFRDDLTKLLSNISESEPSFIRCIKSNERSNVGIFESLYVLKQLRYTGITEVCRIRQRGFPVRLKFGDFLAQYMCLCESAEKKSIQLQESPKLQCERICSRLGDVSIYVGHTKIFLRKEEIEKLEMLKEEVRLKKAEIIQTLVVQFLNSLRGSKLRTCLLELKHAVNKRDVAKIDICLNVLEEIPIASASARIDEMKDEARDVRKEVALEEKEKQKLLKAVEEGDIEKVDALCESIHKLAAKWGDRNLPERLEVEQAKQLVREHCGVFTLKNAIDAGSLLPLYDALGDLKYSHHKCYRDAQMKCLDLEYDLKEELKVLANNNRISGITTLQEVDETSNEVDRIIDLLSKSPITSTATFVADIKRKISTRLRGKRMVFYIKYLHVSVRNRDPVGIEKYSTLLLELDETSDAITQLLNHAGELKRRCEEENAIKIRLDKALASGNYSEAQKICDYVDMRSNKLKDKDIKRRLNLFDARARIIELKTQKRENENITENNTHSSNNRLTESQTRDSSGVAMSTTPQNAYAPQLAPTELPDVHKMTMYRTSGRKRISSNSTNASQQGESTPSTPKSPRNNIVPSTSTPEEHYDSAQNLIAALVLKADLNSRMRQARYRMENKTKPQEKMKPIEAMETRQTRKRKGRCAIA